jgi:membrane protease subunit (stomatin/prohibitin family)
MVDVQKADALSGARGNAFMQQAAARGIQAAGENGGGAAMAFMGMGMNAANGMMGAVQQQPAQSSYQPAFNQPAAAPANEVQVAPVPTAQSETTTKLLEMKQLLDAGAITQEDYDAVKKQLLGL